MYGPIKAPRKENTTQIITKKKIIPNVTLAPVESAFPMPTFVLSFPVPKKKLMYAGKRAKPQGPKKVIRPAKKANQRITKNNCKYVFLTLIFFS